MACNTRYSGKIRTSKRVSCYAKEKGKEFELLRKPGTELHGFRYIISKLTPLIWVISSKQTRRFKQP